MSKNDRTYQVILIGSFLPFCWLAFMVVHELGHVVVGLATGGSIAKVVVHPLSISRTDVSPNPQPLLVAWAGPIFGVGIPLLAWGACWKLKVAEAFLARFLAGFCLIANGAYISVGSFDSIGDAGVMQDNGSPIWMLWLFGLITVPLGFLTWHKLGPQFGLGETAGEVTERSVYVSTGLLGLTIIATSLLSSRF